MLETLYSDVMIVKGIDYPGYTRTYVQASQLSDDRYTVIHRERFHTFGTVAGECDIAFDKIESDSFRLLHPSRQPESAKIFTRDEAITLIRNFNGAAKEMRNGYRNGEHGEPTRVRGPLTLLGRRVASIKDNTAKLAA